MINGTINEEDLNYEVIYNSNNHPLYKSVNNKNIIKDNEDWDDSEILAIFDQAIKTHRTKFQEKKIVEQNDVTDSTSLNKTNDSKKKRKIDNNTTTINNDNNVHYPTNIYNKANEIHSNYLNSYTRSALVHSTELLPYNESSNINNNDNYKQNSNTNYHHHIDTTNATNITNTSTATIQSIDIDNSKKLQEDALQSMLLAWYHSGYATGRYETMKEFGIIDDTIPLKDTI